jgi:large subunit ribosomal protein L10
MHKDDKERVVADLTATLRKSEALIVTDYRGLTMPQVDKLRGRLLEHGARFAVVKNTLTRRAATEAGAEALLAMLEGPSAIAFVESEGDMVEVARVLSESARETRILVIRGGVMQGRTISGADVEELSKLPPFDVLRSQVLGAITAPLTSMLALLAAPLQNLIGLIDARIEQLGGADAAVAASAGPKAAADEPQAEASDEPTADEAAAEAAGGEPVAEAATATEAETESESNSESDDQEVDDGGS